MRSSSRGGAGARGGRARMEPPPAAAPGTGPAAPPAPRGVGPGRPAPLPLPKISDRVAAGMSAGKGGLGLPEGPLDVGRQPPRVRIYSYSNLRQPRPRFFGPSQHRPATLNRGAALSSSLQRRCSAIAACGGHPTVNLCSSNGPKINRSPPGLLEIPRIQPNHRSSSTIPQLAVRIHR